ncbi:PadR family transcriptional regulator [Paenibacillus sp. 1011MAR3C5]|uniref:PadR family transcriptional regulator n=1 Tax=Paenibacillus sp. 1011MAR3C5 TaxID=1675787 RepID=UPI001C724D2F|nr:PadR family transcriptional regulator [Paenibacillus sp. 1011MAR3C5]
MTNKEWNEQEQLFLHRENGREWSSSGRRFFSRGGVKYALLELLMIEPMHGYQMIKHLEEQSAGTYKPSAGSIYPTLQLLSDQGFVSAKKESGKKIFEITEDGRVFLLQEREENKDSSADNTHPPGTTRSAPNEDEWPMRGQDGGRFSRGGDILHSRERHHGYAGHGRRGSERGDCEYGALGSPRAEHDEEQSKGRNRRLTPAGKQLFHQLKTAERAAMEVPAKAERLREILNELREALHGLTEGK